MLQESQSVLKDWLVVFLTMDNGRMTDFLINISVFEGITAMFTIMVLSKLFVLSCPFLFCSEPVLKTERLECIIKLLVQVIENAFLLHCKDLSSMLHVLEADETPWKQRGLLMAFQFSHKVFGTLCGWLASSLATRLFVCMPVQFTGNVLCSYFFFNSSSQSCLERQTISKFFVPSIFRK